MMLVILLIFVLPIIGMVLYTFVPSTTRTIVRLYRARPHPFDTFLLKRSQYNQQYLDVRQHRQEIEDNAKRLSAFLKAVTESAEARRDIKQVDYADQLVWEKQYAISDGRAQAFDVCVELQGKNGCLKGEWQLYTPLMAEIAYVQNQVLKGTLLWREGEKEIRKLLKLGPKYETFNPIFDLNKGPYTYDATQISIQNPYRTFHTSSKEAELQEIANDAKRQNINDTMRIPNYKVLVGLEKPAPPKVEYKRKYSSRNDELRSAVRELHTR
jgi:hypothetical protein